MAIEVSSDRAICCRCGIQYSRRKSFFPVSYAALYKGTGYLPVCKKCVDDIYSNFLNQCNDSKKAVQQTCRKLDLYWNEKFYEAAMKRTSTRSVMSKYMTVINTTTCTGKSYDDTLEENKVLWNLDFKKINSESKTQESIEQEKIKEKESIPEDVIEYWGTEYTPSVYKRLEQKKKAYMAKMPDSDIDLGKEILIKQVCILEVSIEKDSAAGKSIDKSVNSLNTLVGSLNLKPAQQKESDDTSLDKTPMGVWIHKIENKRPIKEVDPEFKDIDGIIRYISIYFLGHACKMLGIKNTYCKLYEDELAKLRILRPEYEGDDDEDMFNDIYSGESNE